ncbi:deoxyribose-phosphate aldolase [Mycoplasmatota bacterium]|nr:deoxyribose-phosphate aldolase [Mycoplasmatota bacterium]
MELDKLIERIAEEVYRKIAKENNGAFNVDTNSNNDIASIIDHTILKPDATEADVRKVCDEAIQYKFKSVCVNTHYVTLVSRHLLGSGVETCCVVGFPLGASTTRAKVDETIDAIKNGANEIDMVINIGAIKSGDWDLVKRDIEGVTNAAKGRALVKVILETSLLNEEEKIKACTIAKMAGADFVKTSTGFNKGGATVEDIRLMRKVVGPNIGVKASGGVRDTEKARAMIAAGANRIGTSSGINIVKGTNPTSGSY